MKKLVYITVLLVIFSTLTACQLTDVVGKKSIESFKNLSDSMKENVMIDENGYALNSLDEAEALSVGKNVSIILEAEPFINAGLDVSKLPQYISLKENKLVIESGLVNNETKDNILETMEQTIWNNRKKLVYHADHDIFEINFENENSFRWAKDTKTNERDFAFVLNPKPFIEAGLDTYKLEFSLRK